MKIKDLDYYFSFFIVNASLNKSRGAAIQQEYNKSFAAANRGSSEEKAIALEVKNLTKTFGKKEANRGLNFKCYQGEIFGLLGHNGAGKTTMISQITGMIPCTSGDAVIAEKYSISKNMDQVRQNVSLCPQVNPMWDDWTLRRHCTYFAELRGIPKAHVEATIESYAEKLGILMKLETKCSLLIMLLRISRQECLAVSVLFKSSRSQFYFIHPPSPSLFFVSFSVLLLA